MRMYREGRPNLQSAAQKAYLNRPTADLRMLCICIC